MSDPKNDLHQAVQNLLEAMRANEAEAFKAGWNACFRQHDTLLLSHGITDQTRGFPKAWSQYVDQQEGWETT